ncbi:MAG: helix-turn-helix domain-containing protein [Thermoanaerobaculia bacterium]
MSQKELCRARVLALVTEGHLSAQAAAERMGLSPRQARRLLRRYEQNGAAGLAPPASARPAGCAAWWRLKAFYPRWRTPPFDFDEGLAGVDRHPNLSAYRGHLEAVTAKLRQAS